MAHTAIIHHTTREIYSHRNQHYECENAAGTERGDIGRWGAGAGVGRADLEEVCALIWISPDEGSLSKGFEGVALAVEGEGRALPHDVF